MERLRLYLASALILASVAVPSRTLLASCIRMGNPEAREVEVLECINAQDYFESHYSQLHPPSPEPGPPDPRKVFEGQLASQPGVVLRVKVLRLREYMEPDSKSERYRWAGAWREKPKEETLYLRQQTASCGAVEVRAKVALIPAPQCCDTNYLGEIGCHLKLGMVQDLPDDLRPKEER